MAESHLEGEVAGSSVLKVPLVKKTPDKEIVRSNTNCQRAVGQKFDQALRKELGGVNDKKYAYPIVSTGSDKSTGTPTRILEGEAVSQVVPASLMAKEVPRFCDVSSHAGVVLTGSGQYAVPSPVPRGDAVATVAATVPHFRERMDIRGGLYDVGNCSLDGAGSTRGGALKRGANQLYAFAGKSACGARDRVRLESCSGRGAGVESVPNEAEPCSGLVDQLYTGGGKTTKQPVGDVLTHALERNHIYKVTIGLNDKKLVTGNVPPERFIERNVDHDKVNGYAVVLEKEIPPNVKNLSGAIETAHQVTSVISVTGNDKNKEKIPVFVVSVGQVNDELMINTKNVKVNDKYRYAGTVPRLAIWNDERTVIDQEFIPRGKVKKTPINLVCSEAATANNVADTTPMFIKVKVDGHTMRAALDTGAPVSLISEALWRDVQTMNNDGSNVLAPWKRDNLTWGDGGSVRMLGTTFHQVVIGGKKVILQFGVVTDMTVGLLLGNDTIVGCGMHIDAENLVYSCKWNRDSRNPRCKTFKEENARIYVTGDTQREHRLLLAKEDVMLPARAQTKVHASVAGFKEGTKVKVGPTGRERNWYTPWGIGCEVQANTISMLLVNTNQTDLIVPRGAVIGRAWTLTDSEAVSIWLCNADSTGSAEDWIDKGVSEEDATCEFLKNLAAEAGIGESYEANPVKSSTPSDPFESYDWDKALGHLSQEHRKMVQIVLCRHRKTFADSLQGSTANIPKVAEHAIEVEANQVVRRGGRRFSHTERESIAQEVEKMLQNRVIRPSFSAWSAPVVLAPKKDGTVRFCVDYRGINAITVKDSYPLPNITEYLELLNGMKFFTLLDLASGYWQIAIAERDKPKTAFTVPNGHYEYNVLPFGLTNAPATFQRTMELVLAGLLGKKCLVYIDDYMDGNCGR